MAKFGEGDKRWIVEDREDGRNVHNWHWTETDCMGWATKRAGQLFEKLALLDDDPVCRAFTTGVDSITGEAFVNMRKGKIISTYELEMRIGWTGSVKNGDGDALGSGSGTVHFPYLGVENYGEEPEIRVTVEDADSAGSALKEAVRTKGKEKLLEALSTFLRELKFGGPAQQKDAEDPKDASAPATKAGSSNGSGIASNPAPPASNQTPKKPEKKSKPSSKQQQELSEQFYASSQDLYDCFTKVGKVQAFTQSAAKVEEAVGGEFSWFGGSVTGKFRELENGKKIVMDWRFNNWEEDCFSKVVLEFESPTEGTTVVKLRQTGIPEADRYGNEDVLQVTMNGWRGQVFHRIRGVFGYGV